MPTSKIVYPDSSTLTSDIFFAERNQRRDTSSEWLDAIREQVEVLYYAAMVCGPGGLTRVDTRWIGFSDSTKRPKPRSREDVRG